MPTHKDNTAVKKGDRNKSAVTYYDVTFENMIVRMQRERILKRVENSLQKP